MDLRLAGKRALVTGGSLGIGRATARQLAAEGVQVVIAARNEERLASAAEALRHETQGDIRFCGVDTGSDASVEALMSFVVDTLGGIDILVNAAATPGGSVPPPKLDRVTADLIWSDVNVKVVGYLRTARLAAPHMVAAGWGRIINVSGLAARQTGSIIGSIRNVSVAALTKNLADELGPKGVNVTVVHPGATRTERTPARIEQLVGSTGMTTAEAEKQLGGRNTIERFVDASEVADVITFLASPRSGAINGDVVACGGGARGSIHY